MYLLSCCCLCCLCFVLCVRVYVFVLFCFSCYQLCRMFLYKLITGITIITKHTTKNMYVFVVVCCCLCCFWGVLFVHVPVFVLFCFFFPTMRMFLYRWITNITNTTTHKGTKSMYVSVLGCCCLCCFFLCCLFMFLCLVCFVFSCFQLCCMFLYRLITNRTNTPKHKTKKHVWFCCWLLLCVLFVFFCVVCSFFCVCFVLLFLVSNCAACSFIG